MANYVAFILRLYRYRGYPAMPVSLGMGLSLANACSHDERLWLRACMPSMPTASDEKVACEGSMKFVLQIHRIMSKFATNWCSPRVYQRSQFSSGTYKFARTLSSNRLHARLQKRLQLFLNSCFPRRRIVISLEVCYWGNCRSPLSDKSAENNKEQ
jgi:hypothetical protein